MKTFNMTYSMAAMALAACGMMSSCTSDDDTATDGQNDSSIQNAITMTLSIEDNEATKTRTGIDHQEDDVRKIDLYKDDYIWAYSANAEGYTNGWYNKLVPSQASDDKGKAYNDFTTTNTTLVYTSEGEVHYKAKDLLLLLYGGNRANQDEANAGEGDADIKAGIYTLTRNSNDHHTAYIYGNGDGVAYSDAKNNYSFRAAYGYINEKGGLSRLKNTETKDEDGNKTYTYSSAGSGAINLTSYMPLLLFSLPAVGDDYTAKKAEVDEYLSALDYKVMVDAVPKDATTMSGQTTKSGYPQEVRFRIITDPANLDYQKCVAPATEDPIEMSETPLRLHYDPSLTKQDENGKGEPSTWLWNTTITTTKKETSVDEDFCKGYIYVPIPPADYYMIRVAIKVDNSSCTDAVKTATSEICGVYTTVINGKDNLDGGTFPNIGFDQTEAQKDIKDRVNAIYDLGNIWTRTTALGTTTASGAPKKSVANTAKGWTFTPNGEFNW